MFKSLVLKKRIFRNFVFEKVNLYAKFFGKIFMKLSRFPIVVSYQEVFESKL